ncbi:TPA: DUF3265 domain-containing protein [Vibrio parahaemolyticus]|nr:DUF3265 domain-containing protein [Vibrio parahaemolyticus]
MFKRDSQRVAFSVCVGLSDKGGMRQLRYCVATPNATLYNWSLWWNINLNFTSKVA